MWIDDAVLFIVVSYPGKRNLHDTWDVSVFKEIDTRLLG